ncbi:MAG: tRNA 2-thiouridine(34) synthase MnmA [Patescibacteria group bacterium]
MKKNQDKKVVVAMSGGVDSSVVAALLKNQGYNVMGVFMQFWFPSGEKYGENRCCSLAAWNEAKEVAHLLDIPIHKVNFGKEFKKIIVDEFLAEYKAGRTPNPCVACNKFIKFKLLLDYARTVFDADYVATGHYVRLKPQVKNLKTGAIRQFDLYRPKDKNKDQTYFLYNLKQEQLKHLLFPLAGYTKDQVRGLAKKFKLAVHAKPDSQEICFVGQSHTRFLKKYLGLKEGEIINEKGEAVGKHQGLSLYTLGQRSGIGLSGGPWYVIGFNRKKNKLVVSKKFDSDKLYNRRVFFKSANWLTGKIQLPLSCEAQIRYHVRPEKCRVKKIGRRYLAEFVQSPRAATPGQSIVFYDNNQLLGGGVIE